MDLAADRIANILRARSTTMNLIGGCLIVMLLCGSDATADKSTSDSDTDAPFRAKALEIYRTSVEMRTVEGRGLVTKLAQYLASEFEKAGFLSEDIHVLRMDGTAALVVRYRGDATSGKKPVSISAHMDVVDARRDEWERDPFTLVEESGYFYGRGVDDNKLGLTAVVSGFLRLKSEGWVPKRDLIVVLSGDEETSMRSTRALVSEYRDLIDSEFVLNADAGGAILPEDGGRPASFSIQAAEKTYATWELTVTNPGGHSSRPRKDNAIYDLARALTTIEGHEFAVNHNEITLSYFRSTGSNTGGDLGTAMLRFAEDPRDKWAAKVLRSNSSHAGTIGTTCVPTMLRGGHAENALPQTASVTVNCRIFPGESVAAIEAKLREVVSDDRVQFELLHSPTESEASPLREDVLNALRKAVDTKYPDLPIIPSMSSFGTDGKHFRSVGIPSYGVNGMYGKVSDNFAHGLNERILVETFYGNLVHWYVLLKEIGG